MTNTGGQTKAAVHVQCALFDLGGGERKKREIPGRLRLRWPWRCVGSRDFYFYRWSLIDRAAGRGRRAGREGAARETASGDRGLCLPHTASASRAAGRPCVRTVGCTRVAATQRDSDSGVRGLDWIVLEWSLSGHGAVVVVSSVCWCQGRVTQQRAVSFVSAAWHHSVTDRQLSEESEKGSSEGEEKARDRPSLVTKGQ